MSARSLSTRPVLTRTIHLGSDSFHPSWKAFHTAVSCHGAESGENTNCARETPQCAVHGQGARTNAAGYQFINIFREEFWDIHNRAFG